MIFFITSKFYIGKTNDLELRYESHKSGQGAEWTKKYPPNKIVMGMLYTQDYNSIEKTIKQLSNKYSNFGGVFLWEYCYSKMNKFCPIDIG